MVFLGLVGVGVNSMNSISSLQLIPALCNYGVEMSLAILFHENLLMSLIKEEKEAKSFMQM